MNVSAAKILINQHNNGEIHIQSIISNAVVLINNINVGSKLNYNEERHTLTYINEQGYVNTIADVDVIDQILYRDINDDDSDSNDNPSDENNDCPCGDDCPCNDDEIDSNESFPEIAIVSQGYVKNGIIYPTELEDGTLIYDCSMGTIKEYICGKHAGTVKTDNNIFSKYFGNGYVLLKYGLLDMNIYVPDSGMYNITVRAGSECNSGKRGSIFINNTERFIRTSANMKGIWEIKYPEKYCEEDDYFLEIDSNKLLSGTNKITLRVDQARGTVNNAYDCLIFKKDDNQPMNPDCDEYFHITEKQYIELKKSIDDLNNITNEMKLSLNRTFLVLDNSEDLFYLTDDQLTEGRIFKVNNVGDGSQGYYVYNKSSGFVKFDFSDPKAFITLDNYADLVEFTETNKSLLVHGKLVRVNRPSSDDIDITIEDPEDFLQPAYYYYDIHSEKWLLINFNSGSSSSLTEDDVKKLIKNHNEDIDSHANTFITVNSLSERDSIKKVDGRIVRVNSVSENDIITSKYYRWDEKNSSWVTENFGFNESTVIHPEQIDGLDNVIDEKVSKTIEEQVETTVDEKVSSAIEEKVPPIVEEKVQQEVNTYFMWSEE